MGKGRRDVLHCSQKGGNRWLGASPSARKMKAQKSISRHSISTQKMNASPLMLLPKMWFLLQLKPIWTHTRVCVLLPFPVSPAITGTRQLRPTCWYSCQVHCFSPFAAACTAPQLPAWGRQSIIISVDDRKTWDSPFQGWFVTANLGK